MESPYELSVHHKLQGNLPQMDSLGNLEEKGFGFKACQSVIRFWEKIQNIPWKWCQNVIALFVSWENPNPIHGSVTTKGLPTHYHLI
jgi:hypothetical protein